MVVCVCKCALKNCLIHTTSRLITSQIVYLIIPTHNTCIVSACRVNVTLLSLLTQDLSPVLKQNMNLFDCVIAVIVYSLQS